MRVLVVSQYFWPESFRINDLAKTLQEKGIEVEVLTGQPNYPHGNIFSGYKAWKCQQEMYHNITISRIPLFVRGRGGWRLALNYLSFVASGLLFGPWMLRSKKFDVIFVYGTSPILQAIPAIFLGKLKKCPTVLWIQDLWPDSLSATGHVKNRTILKLIEWVTRLIYRYTDLLLVQSQAFETPVRSLASATPIMYFPNFVDNIFSVPAITEALPVDGLGEYFSIMFAGNIGAAQAVECIVDAADLLRGYTDIRFIIFGHGSRFSWMQEEIKKRGLSNLHLLGQYPIETMPAFMQKASALLVTLSDQPIFSFTVPSKVQAYMAAGRPILACLNGEGARIVLEAKAGIVSCAEDASALADSIIHLYKMTDVERAQMGANGRLYFNEHFDQDMLTNQLIAHFRTVSESSKGN